VVEALVLISVLTFLVVNLAIDLLYAYLDPRVSYR
jgi:ABC-type dipeptide/oligopeptide/nickel transport system permease component